MAVSRIGWGYFAAGSSFNSIPPIDDVEECGLRGQKEVISHQFSVFSFLPSVSCLLSSVFHLPSSIFYLPPSVFCLPPFSCHPDPSAGGEGSRSAPPWQAGSPTFIFLNKLQYINLDGIISFFNTPWTFDIGPISLCEQMRGAAKATSVGTSKPANGVRPGLSCFTLVCLPSRLTYFRASNCWFPFGPPG